LTRSIDAIVDGTVHGCVGDAVKSNLGGLHPASYPIDSIVLDAAFQRTGWLRKQDSLARWQASAAL
jgi:hypothetical protein